MIELDVQTGLQKEIETLESEVADKKQQLAELRKKLPAQKIDKAYVFTSREGKPVRFDDLFGDKNELILVHNMGKSCAYCTLWADGFNGILRHLQNRAAFAVVSPNEWEAMRDFADGKGWNFNICSSRGTSFKKDMGFEGGKGNSLPGVSAFVKKDGEIFHTANAGFGPGDNYCMLVDLFDLLPGGVGDWMAKLSY